MAWLSLIGGLSFPFLLSITTIANSPAAASQLGAIAAPFYLFVSAVVGSYIGFATIDDKWQKPTGEDKV